MPAMSGPLTGNVAVVTGATRRAGRGTAVSLGEPGATLYCTGRTTRARRSEYDRPQTIEEAAELVDGAGGEGIAVEVDHPQPAHFAPGLIIRRPGGLVVEMIDGLLEYNAGHYRLASGRRAARRPRASFPPAGWAALRVD
jgi:NAD(P)-dependent dehydrogenase (short-subunit alcohol dehydrogenase family)